MDLQRDILTFFGERIFGVEKTVEPVTQELAYKFIYTSTGSFGIIYHWLMDDNAVSVDTVADLIFSLNVPHQKN